jgi:hypothetical protein
VTNRDYQIALRDDDLGLDDVVVKDVEMFRMERMSETSAWLCCYLPDGQRITFWVHGKNLRYRATEFPDVKYEDGREATLGKV